jgi:hypothetical protein
MHTGDRLHRTVPKHTEACYPIRKLCYTSKQINSCQVSVKLFDIQNQYGVLTEFTTLHEEINVL